MAVKITSIKEAVVDNGVKILIYGDSGAGKTVFCCTSGTPTLLLNVEGGLLSVKDAPDYIHTVKIKTLADFEEVYAMLLSKIGDNQVYDWIALDSITEIAETVLIDELEKCADPRKSYPAFQSQITSLIKGYRDLPGYNVIMTCKQGLVKDEYTGITKRSPLMPGNKLGPAIPYLYDEVFNIRVEVDDEGQDYRVIQTDLDIMYFAKDRSGNLSKFEKPSLASIYRKIHGMQGQELIQESKDSKAAMKAIIEAEEESQCENSDE